MTELEVIDFTDLAGAGYYLAVRVGFAFPEYEENTLPRAWVLLYTRDALMLQDPVMRWVYGNSGAVRWSGIALDDPAGVLRRAASHGMTYGASVCVMDGSEAGLRTFGMFARSDREYTDGELDLLERHLRALHRRGPIDAHLTAAEVETLSMLRDGMLMKEIAHTLGITESAVKQRLKSAKSKLTARTATHAVALAERRGLLGRG